MAATTPGLQGSMMFATCVDTYRRHRLDGFEHCSGCGQVFPCTPWRNAHDVILMAGVDPQQYDRQPAPGVDVDPGPALTGSAVSAAERVSRYAAQQWPEQQWPEQQRLGAAPLIPVPQDVYAAPVGRAAVTDPGDTSGLLWHRGQ